MLVREIKIKGRYCPKGTGAQKLRLTLERRDWKKDRDGREESEYAILKREVVIKSRGCSKGDTAQAKRQKETRVEREKKESTSFFFEDRATNKRKRRKKRQESQKKE